MSGTSSTSSTTGSSLASARSETGSIPSLRFAHAITRRALYARLSHLREGSLVFVDDGRTRSFGRSDGDPTADAGPNSDGGVPLRVRVDVHDPRFYTAVALRGSIGAAESWMDGDWSCGDLVSLFRVLMRNESALHGLDHGFARIAGCALRFAHRLHRNSHAGARRNVAAHYDLGNDFYARFLDPSLTYSAGIFDPPGCTLEAASTAKYERICHKLDLSPDDHLLEIGCGWGGFAIHAASRHGCRVTATTISREQRELALERVARAGLEGRVEIVLEDYRSLTGRFDKLVSIEMIEAVGHRYLDDFFRACADRLAPDGLMCLQCITTPDRRYAESVRSTDFIKRYIFPGGQLVSLGAIAASTAPTDLRVEHVEDLTPHYAETLRHWRARFHDNRDEIRRLGYPEQFLRMWDFYLASCEGSFRERYTGSMQIVLAKDRARGAPLLGSLERKGP